MLCIDFSCGLNKSETEWSFRLVAQRELRRYLSKHNYAANIDLKNSLRKYMAFTWKGNFFRFKRMAFGLAGAPYTFQKIMEFILRDLPVIVYLDDVLIGGKNKEDCEALTKTVLERLAEYEFEINEKKSWLSPSDKFRYLGAEFNLTSGKTTISREFQQDLIIDLKNRKYLIKKQGHVSFSRESLVNLRGFPRSLSHFAVVGLDSLMASSGKSSRIKCTTSHRAFAFTDAADFYEAVDISTHECFQWKVRQNDTHISFRETVACIGILENR